MSADITAEQREAMEHQHLAGGLFGYITRLRESHRPTFTKGWPDTVVYSGCSCGEFCPIPYLLLHANDLLRSYEMKVEDLRAETLRTSALSSSLERMLARGHTSYCAGANGSLGRCDCGIERARQALREVASSPVGPITPIQSTPPG